MKADTGLAIALTVLHDTVAEAEGGLEGKLRAAMAAVCGHAVWWTTDEQDLLRYAVGAVMAHYGKDSPEWARLEHEWKALQLLSASLAKGSLDGVLEHLEAPGAPEPVGLMLMWHEAKEAADGARS